MTFEQGQTNVIKLTVITLCKRVQPHICIAQFRKSDSRIDIGFENSPKKGEEGFDFKSSGLQV